MQEINKEILLYLNSLLDYKFVENFVLIFADGPILLLPLFLVFYWIYFTYKLKLPEKKIGLLHIFYSCVIAIVINLIIQQLFHFDRPETAIEWTWKLILSHIPDASFPSDHAAVSIAFLTWLFLAWYKKVAYVFLILAVCMNISRVIAGVHWPFDILIWALVWTIWWFLSFKIALKNKYFQKVNDMIIKLSTFFKL